MTKDVLDVTCDGVYMWLEFVWKLTNSLHGVPQVVHVVLDRITNLAGNLFTETEINILPR